MRHYYKLGQDVRQDLGIRTSKNSNVCDQAYNFRLPFRYCLDLKAWSAFFLFPIQFLHVQPMGILFKTLN